MAQVTTRSLSFLEIVQKAWGKDWTKPDIAYEFTNRTFEDHSVNFGIGAVGSGLDGYADGYSDNYT